MKRKQSWPLIILLCTAFFFSQIPAGHTADLSELDKVELQRMAIKQFLYENNIDSLIKYVQWLQKNVKYQQDADGKDNWASPLETLTKKFGDCEDLSFLNAEVLKLFGFTPQVVGYGHSSYAHVVCLFKINNGNYYMFDNTRLVQTDAENLETIAKAFAAAYHSTHFFELNYSPRVFRILYMMEVHQKA